MLTPFFPSSLSAAQKAAAAAPAPPEPEAEDSCVCTYCLEDYGPIDTAQNTTATFVAACTFVGAAGGGVICLPPGILTMDALAATAVGTNEGAAVLMTAAMSNIIFRGNGTTIKPVSNRVELFAIDGASNIRFKGITFDNREHGVLTNVPHRPDGEPGTGVAGHGCAANCAIRQYRGNTYPSNAITAASWAATDGGEVTFATTTAHGIVPNTLFNIYGTTPNGYNGTYTAKAGTTGLTLKGIKPSSLGVCTVLGALAVGGDGGDVYVDDCEFLHFYTCLDYNGNKSNPAATVGTASLTNSRCDGCVMGLLPAQAAHIVCSGNRWLNGVNGQALNPGDIAENVPGHLLYTSSSSTAWPLTVVANGNYAHTTESSVLKMRKGWSQSAVGNAFYKVGRGIECHNTSLVSITGNSISLMTTDDDFQNCIEVTGCRGGEIANNALERSGGIGPCIRVRPADVEVDVEDLLGELPRNLRIHHNTMVDDGSGSVHKPFIVVQQATDCEVSDNIVRHLQDFSTGAPVVHVIDEHVVELKGCTRARAFNNQRRTAIVSNPTGSHKLVNLLDEDGPPTLSADCIVTFRRSDLDVPPTSTTILDAGTGPAKIMRNDGEETGTWTPTLAFATPGDGVITVNSHDCLRFKRGGRVTLIVNVNFSTNAYTTAAGALRLSGFPDVSSEINARVGVGNHQNLAGATSIDIGAALDTGNSFFTFRRNVVAATGNTLDVVTFPASTANFVLGFQISYVTPEV